MLTAIAAIFVFGLLITSHEFGHFITAKLSGVKVLEFSIGMGPKILGFNKNETDYSLRIFPIGGYVRMLGEEGESNDPRAFCNAPVFKRLIIIIAGAFMNFVIAIILFFMIAYNVGVATKPIVGKLEAGYPAITSGVKVNDKITAVNNKKITQWDEFINFVRQNNGKPFKMTIERNNKPIDINIKPILSQKEGRYIVGITAANIKGDFRTSLVSGVKETFSSIKQMLVFLKGAFHGKISTNDLGGPVLIVKMSGQAARMGIWSLLAFTAFLSINLGIINLIPFPALDGGWVVILLLEAITRKKIDENKIGYLNLVGFAILITFTIWITFKDILKIKSF